MPEKWWGVAMNGLIERVRRFANGFELFLEGNLRSVQLIYADSWSLGPAVCWRTLGHRPQEREMGQPTGQANCANEMSASGGNPLKLCNRVCCATHQQFVHKHCLQWHRARCWRPTARPEHSYKGPLLYIVYRLTHLPDLCRMLPRGG